MYKLIKPMYESQTTQVVQRLSDNAFIPFDPDNTDAQQFKIWLQEGNIPTSADGETIVTQEDVDAIITLLNG